MTMTKHTCVDLYETGGDDLILVIDETSRWYFAVPDGVTFREDGNAILRGDWHPNVEDGQTPVPDDEWEHEYAAYNGPCAPPQVPIATMTSDGLEVHGYGCGSARQYLGPDAIQEDTTAWPA